MRKLMVKKSIWDSTKEQLISLRDRFLIGMVEWTKPHYAKWFKSQQRAWRQTVESMKKMPRKSLGHDLALFLEREGLTLMPKLEEHDVMHILLQYETTVKDEARMQFFLLGNGKRSLYALFTAMASFVLIPEYIGEFRRAFREGRHCRCIASWNFEHLLMEPTSLLRKLIYRKDVGVEAPFVF